MGPRLRGDDKICERSTMDFSLFYLPTYRAGFAPSLNAFYGELTQSVKLADRLGWARVLTTEHHFHYYGGAVPNPAVILAAWARETKRIRLSAGVSLVPLRANTGCRSPFSLASMATMTA